MEKENNTYSDQITSFIKSIDVTDCIEGIKKGLYVVLLTGGISAPSYALSKVDRLQDTKNIAEDFNNPANLVLGRKGSKANSHAIGYVPINYGGTTRKFLVFCSSNDGYAAMRESIYSRQNKSPNRTLREFIDLWVTGKWKPNVNSNGWVGGTRARGNYQRKFFETIKESFSLQDIKGVSLNAKISGINAHVIAVGLAGGEGYKGGNNKYANSNYCK